MAVLGVDYSFARPLPSAIKQSGYKFVCRYFASSAGKAITKAEADSLHAVGLALVMVFEDYANQALNGYSQGVADAKEALSQANAIGMPTDRPIYFAVDFDISDAQKPTAGQYMKGVASVLGLSRVGAYGGYWWVKYCVDNKLASYFWQACAWSGSLVHGSAHIYQNGQSAFNGGADVDEALKTDYGQWPEGDVMQIETTPPIFNKDYYLKVNPDVARAGIDPVAHWLKDGITEGRASAPNFHVKEYVANYTDLTRVFGKDYASAIKHYFNSGIEEGRYGTASSKAAADKLASDNASLTQQVADDKGAITTLTAKVAELEAELNNQPKPTPAPEPSPAPTPPAPTPAKSHWYDWILYLIGIKK